MPLYELIGLLWGLRSPVAISTRSLRRPRVRVTQSRDYHRGYFGGEVYEAVAFNKVQHIAVVGQRVTPEIRRTAPFLGSKGIHVTCVEFTFSTTWKDRRNGPKWR